MAYSKLQWRSSENRFEFSDDLYVDGDLIVSGVIYEGGAMKKKTLDWTGVVTGSTIWDPTPGKTWNLTCIVINATDDCTVTIFDDTNSTTNRIYKGKMAALQTVVIPLKPALPGGAADNILKLTTSAAGGQITVFGYET